MGDGSIQPLFSPWGSDINGAEEEEGPRVVETPRGAELQVQAAFLDEIEAIYDSPLGIVDTCVGLISRLGHEFGPSYARIGEAMWRAVLRTVSLDMKVVDAQTYTRRPIELDDLANTPIADAVERFMRGSPRSRHESEYHPANPAGYCSEALPCSDTKRIRRSST